MTSLTPHDADDVVIPPGTVIVTREDVIDGQPTHTMHAHVVSFSDEALAVLAAKVVRMIVEVTQ